MISILHPKIRGAQQSGNLPVIINLSNKDGSMPSSFSGNIIKRKKIKLIHFLSNLTHLTMHRKIKISYQTLLQAKMFILEVKSLGEIALKEAIHQKARRKT